MKYKLEFLKTIITGLIDGLTGFLPVGSSGHIAILRNTFGITVKETYLLDICLKLAALAVIVFSMKKDVRGVINGAKRLFVSLLVNISTFFGNINKMDKEEYVRISDYAYTKLLAMILIATIPTGIIGVVSRDLVDIAGGTVIFPGIFTIITGACLFVVNDMADGTVKPKDATYFGAFLIGVFQGFSAFPGLSRVGLVVSCCLLLHFDRKLTFKFTFLSAIPALVGAIFVDIIDLFIYGASDYKMIPAYLLAGILAFITGVFGIRIIHSSILRGKYVFYAIYCLVFGAFALAAMVVL